MQVEHDQFYREATGRRIGPMWVGFNICWERGHGEAVDAEWNRDGTVLIPGPNGYGDLIVDWTDETPHEGTVAMDTHAFADVKIPAPAKPRSIYLSGPMKGYPQSNYPLFNAVAEQLRRAGHHVYNPAEFGADTPFDGFPIRQAFAAYSKFICEEADAIILLPGWEASRGANAEHALAENCGIEIIPFDRLSTTIATEGTF